MYLGALPLLNFITQRQVSAYSLEQGLANHGLLAHTGLLPVFIQTKTSLDIFKGFLDREIENFMIHEAQISVSIKLYVNIVVVIPLHTSMGAVTQL